MIYTVNVDIRNWSWDRWPWSCFLPMYKYQFSILPVKDAHCSIANLFLWALPVVITADYHFPAFLAGWPRWYWAKGKLCLLSFTEKVNWDVFECYVPYRGWFTSLVDLAEKTFPLIVFCSLAHPSFHLIFLPLCPLSYFVCFFFSSLFCRSPFFTFPFKVRRLCAFHVTTHCASIEKERTLAVSFWFKTDRTES